MGWENNTDAVVKKAQRRLYFQRQLKKFELTREILVLFYRSANESTFIFSKYVWFGGISQCQRSWLDRVVKIVGSELIPLTAVYNDISKQVLAILSQTKLTPVIICSDYYCQANVLEASARKHIALEIVFTPCHSSLIRNTM